MGYRHILNAYKDKRFLMFKEVYAMEKVHGTSAHISLKDGKVHYFAGGEKHDNFVKVFDSDIEDRLRSLGHEEITIFGEAYGGKCQGMSATYGKELRFIVFEVKIGDTWLSVPNAENVTNKLGLEFVPYERVPATLEALDKERDRPSRVAQRRGILEEKFSEGIVIRPLEEVTFSNGDRCIVKHKRAEFSERKSGADTNANIDPEKLAVLTRAQDIADEWVTPMRLQHVLDKLSVTLDMSATPAVIRAMQEDVLREAAGEILESKEALKAIANKTSQLYKKFVMSR